MLYDFLSVRGGAEKLTLTLLEAFPEVPLCCAFRDRRVFGDADLPAGGFIDLDAASDIPAWRILKVMRAFERQTQFLADYDWVLYSGVYSPLAVHRHPHGRNLLYCHTIPRFAYDLESYYLSRLPWFLRPAFWGLVQLMRSKYEPALAKMDVVITNSHNVRRRLETYLGRSAIVVHPPVDIDRFRWLGQEDYYVSLARLENFKRVDRIVSAFKQMPDKKLVVLSGGGEFDRLVALADGAPNIHFAGWVSEDKMREIMGKAIASIYIPIDEDFGMSPVESMAAGKPVIGVAEGGLLETIIPGQTGLLLPPDPTVEAIVGAVESMDPAQALSMREACENRAKLFSRNIFLEKMKRIICQDARY